MRKLSRSWYGKFAGILQVEIRQRVSRVRMLTIALFEGNMRSRLLRDPGQNRYAKNHQRLSLAHRSHKIVEGDDAQ
jgi:hypothetical protein